MSTHFFENACLLGEESSAYFIAASKVSTIQKFVEAKNCADDAICLINRFIRSNTHSEFVKVCFAFFF